MNLQKKFIEKALQEISFTSYTEVQEKVIPLFMNRKNIIVEAKTGSGKTHAYLIPILEMLDTLEETVQSVICAPTRELALQIYQFTKQITDKSEKRIDVRLFTGGSDKEVEIERLTKSQPQIVIGTPGRLFDLIRKENVLKAFTAKSFVIDEADMALENGFMEEIDGIASVFSSSCQMVSVSATIPEMLQPFLKKYFQNPVLLQVSKEEVSNLNIKHYFYKTKERDRYDILDVITKAINPYFCIIFCNTKDSANLVYEHTKQKGLNVTLIHGDVDFRKRKQLLAQVKQGRFQYVVATDILARGIDIDGLSHIINFELPKDDSFYIHRSGRTGRMLYNGIAISLYDFADESYLNSLESKGLHCEYITIKNNLIVPAKIHNERNKRQKIESQVVTELKKRTPISKTVKPGYKKKYNEEIKKLTKKATKRSYKK